MSKTLHLGAIPIFWHFAESSGLIEDFTKAFSSESALKLFSLACLWLQGRDPDFRNYRKFVTSYAVPHPEPMNNSTVKVFCTGLGRSLDETAKFFRLRIARINPSAIDRFDTPEVIPCDGTFAFNSLLDVPEYENFMVTHLRMLADSSSGMPLLFNTDLVDEEDTGEVCLDTGMEARFLEPTDILTMPCLPFPSSAELLACLKSCGEYYDYELLAPVEYEDPVFHEKLLEIIQEPSGFRDIPGSRYSGCSSPYTFPLEVSDDGTEAEFSVWLHVFINEDEMAAARSAFLKRLGKFERTCVHRGKYFSDDGSLIFFDDDDSETGVERNEEMVNEELQLCGARILFSTCELATEDVFALDQQARENFRCFTSGMSSVVDVHPLLRNDAEGRERAFRDGRHLIAFAAMTIRAAIEQKLRTDRTTGEEPEKSIPGGSAPFSFQDLAELTRDVTASQEEAGGSWQITGSSDRVRELCQALDLDEDFYDRAPGYMKIMEEYAAAGQGSASAGGQGKAGSRKKSGSRKK